MEIVDDVIVSDIHLGSKVSRSKELLKALEKLQFERLILNGDIFEDLNFERLNSDDWNFLSHIRKLSNPKNGIEVIWIRGNHDNLLIGMASHLLGVEVYNEYEWEREGRKRLAIHGDQFDDFLVNNRVLSDVASYAYYLIQKADSKKQRAGRLVKRLSKSWLRVSNKVADKAAAYARHKGIADIFCGHTHQPMKREYDGGVTYYNSGCWTDIPSNFITIKGSEIKTHEVF
jgi:UDP-2,3-diacylglucosamine pyrophosphatase LpxH